jgi:hypothetical protein
MVEQENIERLVLLPSLTCLKLYFIRLYKVLLLRLSFNTNNIFLHLRNALKAQPMVIAVLASQIKASFFPHTSDHPSSKKP